MTAEDKHLSGKVISGVGWSSAAKFSRQGVQLIFQIFLARILSPKEFGLIAMVVVFTSFADIIKNMGLGQAIIQKNDYDDGHLNTVFWFNVFMGVAINIIFQFSAPLIASFYREPALTPVIRWFSVIYLINSFNIVQEALLQKGLEFKRLFFIEIISVTISGIVALIMALNGWGVWALVAQFLLIAVISTLVLWFTAQWRPAFAFTISKFNDLKKFGLNLLGHELLSFVSRNIDNLLIGRYIGTAALGVYSRAYVLMLQPVNLANQVLARVMFPMFSRLQHNIDSIRSAYLKSTRLLAFIVFPTISVVFVLAKPIIILLLGSQWVEVADILRIFCIYCLLDTIGVTTAWLYKSLGRTDIMFRWAIYYTIILIASIITGLHWGIKGVASAYVISFLVFLWIPGWYIAFKLINLKISVMFNNLGGAFISSLLMGLLVFVWHTNDPVPASAFWKLCITLLISITLYAVISLLFNKVSVQMINALLKKRIKLA